MGIKKYVQIIEKSSNTTIAEYPINLDSLTNIPQVDEYLNEAWSCAVEDGLAQNEDRKLYVFAIKD